MAALRSALGDVWASWQTLDSKTKIKGLPRLQAAVEGFEGALPNDWTDLMHAAAEAATSPHPRLAQVDGVCSIPTSLMLFD